MKTKVLNFKNARESSLKYTLSYRNYTSGYHMIDVENKIFASKTWDEFKQNILTINNPTRCHIENTFNYWISSTSFTPAPTSCMALPVTPTPIYPIPPDIGNPHDGADFCIIKNSTKICY
ncbi:MAG: hypothetical protein QM539_03175 [Alphaproteobacteria bacterium]|nr:hypothetical protein [Alphaproteobacteria bacterium]